MALNTKNIPTKLVKIANPTIVIDFNMRLALRISFTLLLYGFRRALFVAKTAAFSP